MQLLWKALPEHTKPVEKERPQQAVVLGADSSAYNASRGPNDSLLHPLQRFCTSSTFISSCSSRICSRPGIHHSSSFIPTAQLFASDPLHSFDRPPSLSVPGQVCPSSVCLFNPSLSRLPNMLPATTFARLLEDRKFFRVIEHALAFHRLRLHRPFSLHHLPLICLPYYPSQLTQSISINEPTL